MFSGMSITYRSGQIVGVMLGGLLVHPQQRFPRTIFDGVFWKEYPFVLPCFVGGGMALFAAILGMFFLEEVILGRVLADSTLANDSW